SLSIFIIADIFLILRYAGFSIINVVCVSFFFTAYFSIVQVYKVPAEKIHFIEYGLLAFLLFRALKLNVPDKLNYPLSFLIIIMIGWGDEAIQLVVPDRYYDLRDVFLNGLSGGLILLLIFIVEKLKGRKAGPIFK
ncbi:MAG: VanZ family protein, partial [Spirochaetes bacterium]|nr:VanZ family protein [Spirochaetota bacterium]